MAAPITSPEELQRYLTKHDIPAAYVENLTPLNSGANFVWRVTTLLGRTSIVKHAEPYVKGNPTVAFPVERMDFEAKALKELPKYIPEDELVGPAKFIRYDGDAHILSIEDGGPKNLKGAYSDESAEVIQVIGEGLGRWIAGLHDSTKDEEVRQMFNNATVSKLDVLSLYRYQRCHALDIC
jgi:hypothetical protein